MGLNPTRKRNKITKKKKAYRGSNTREKSRAKGPKASSGSLRKYQVDDGRTWRRTTVDSRNGGNKPLVSTNREDLWFASRLVIREQKPKNHTFRRN